MTNIFLTLPAMHCEGCARSVRRIVQKQDPTALAEVDLATKRLHAQGALDEAALRAALAQAGFPAE